MWIAEHQGHAVGTVAAVPQDSELYMRSLAVRPAAAGSGIGSALIDTVEDFARENSFRQITLSTTPFLADAIRTYERHGFTQEPLGPSELYGTPLLTLIKRLGP